MSRSDWLRLGLVIAALGCVIFIAVQARGHQVEPAPTYEDAKFTPFPTPHPSPTPIVGLYDYQGPLGSHQTPEPIESSKPTPRRQKAASPSGQTSSGSGARTIRVRHREIGGRASWHATGRSGLYAAACAPLRRAMGAGWRGSRVLVSYKRKAVEVVLNDWCGSRDKTIDLSDEAFRYFAPLSRGVIRVTIGW